MALATFQELNTPTWLVVTLLYSMNAEHFHSCGKFHRITLNTNNAVFQSNFIVNPMHQGGEKQVDIRFKSNPASEPVSLTGRVD